MFTTLLLVLWYLFRLKDRIYEVAEEEALEKEKVFPMMLSVTLIIDLTLFSIYSYIKTLILIYK